MSRDLTQLSDTELIQQSLIERNRPEPTHPAFGTLVDRYRNDIYRIIYHFLHDPDGTMDILQEVFIKAFQSLPTLQDKTRFKPWLIRIAARTAIDQYRKSVNANKNIEESDTTGTVVYSDIKWKNNPRKVSEIRELNQRISEAVLQLPKQQRIMFIFRYFEDMSIAEIAENLSCSEGTVKANLHHGLLKVRNRLRKNEPGIERETKGAVYARMLSNKTMVSRIPLWGIVAEQIQITEI